MTHHLIPKLLFSITFLLLFFSCEKVENTEKSENQEDHCAIPARDGFVVRALVAAFFEREDGATGGGGDGGGREIVCKSASQHSLSELYFQSRCTSFQHD